MTPSRILASLLAACATLCATPAHADIFTVDTLLDGPPDHDVSPSDRICLSQRGNCSLRAAIEQANFLPGPHEIRFSVAGTISPVTEGALPTITKRIAFRGDTAPGYATGATDIGNAPPRIYLNGSFAPIGTIGLEFGLGSNGSSVRALGIAAMPSIGIDVLSSSDDVLIRDCWIGVAADGTAAGNEGVGIRSNAARTVIGRFDNGVALEGNGNVISANSIGIFLRTGASEARIHGNRIGLTANGLAARGNAGNGIYVDAGTGHRIGGLLRGQAVANLVASNGSSGILLIAGSGHRVQSNRLGLSRTGTSIASADIGIVLINGSADLQIGGGSAEEGNQIANHDIGIRIGHGTAEALRLRVQHNLIGSLVGGIGATGDGIVISDCLECGVISNAILSTGGNGLVLAGNGITAYANRIGFVDTIFGVEDHGVAGDGILVTGEANRLHPSAPGEIGTSYGNRIGFSGGHGIRIEGSGTRVMGAEIGVGEGGVPMPNGGDGIHIRGAVSGTSVQYSAIAHNTGGGIVLDSLGLTAVANNFAANLISSNGGLAIDLGDDGQDALDAGDDDEGPNRRINHPTLLSAERAGTFSNPAVRVLLRIDTTEANASFPLLASFHLSGRDEREALRFIGELPYAMPGSEVALALALPPGVRGGYLTATTRSPETGSSELSPAIAFGIADALFGDGFEERLSTPL